jgi:glycolate oxidase iron-sulfur subunit
MQTALADFIRDTAAGREADAILRTCVHCGFCTATCPTYQLLGDELDGPRGRIYLIKQLLEGHDVTAKTQLHLDRCLTCRSCETTCPSGVNYHRLADIGRGIVAERVPRSLPQRLLRWGLRSVIAHRARFTPLLRLGQLLRGVLPPQLKASVPPRRRAGPWPIGQHTRKMIMLDGCVQPAIAPDINAASARIFDRLQIQIVATPAAGCCGAVSYHLDAHAEGLDFMRRAIDAWWPAIEAGVEAIVITASGCGAVVKEYGHLLSNDPQYAAKAARVSALCKDISEILVNEDLSILTVTPPGPLVFHSPCTLQHGQKLNGVVERLLERLGFQLLPVSDAHLCCGSAGTYSILQKDLSQQLRANKLKALQAGNPVVVATANIGCLTHLQSGTPTPVRHWIEVLDAACG